MTKFLAPAAVPHIDPVALITPVGAGVKQHQFCQFDEQHPMGGDAVKNSIEVSKFFAILAFSCSRCERHSLLGSCPWRELSEAFALRASLGSAYRDDLAGPIESRQGTRASRRTLEILFPLLPVPVDGAGGSSLGLTKVVRRELDPARLRIVLRSQL